MCNGSTSADTEGCTDAEASQNEENATEDGEEKGKSERDYDDRGTIGDGNGSLDGIPEKPRELTIVPREEWGAKPPGQLEHKPHVTSMVLFTYTTGTEPCFTREDCVRITRHLQNLHVASGAPDIAYNFLVGGDGTVYEGRGWEHNPRIFQKYAKLKGYILEFAFIGDYSIERPPEAMFDGVLDMIDFGRNNSFVKKNFGFLENYDNNVELMEDEEIVRRKAWGAVEPGPLYRAMTPLPYIVFTYETKTRPCREQDDCCQVLRDTQKKHMVVLNMPDIAYNFIIGGDGRIYEGRGWQSLPSKFKESPYLNNRAYNVGILGDLMDTLPSKKLWEATWRFVEIAFKTHHVLPNVEFSVDDETDSYSLVSGLR